MIDKISLNKDETFIIDSSTNIISVALIFGNVSITDTNNNNIAVLNDNYDIFTIPANSGLYKLIGNSDYSSVYIFRSFYIWCMKKAIK